MLSDDILSYWAGGSEYSAKLIDSKFLSISHRMLVLAQRWARNSYPWSKV